jgi:uncharacterized protein (DUF1778 family)
MRNKSAAIFIRCSDEDAEKIRNAARAERRTVSGFVLNAVISRIEAREKLLQGAAPHASTATVLAARAGS